MGDLTEPLARLVPLIDDGLAHFDGTRDVVNPDWHVFVRLVCAALDTCLRKGGTVHAKAV